MLDRINELIEMFLVSLGITLNRISDEEKTMVTLFLALLAAAAVMSHVLQATVLR